MVAEIAEVTEYQITVHLSAADHALLDQARGNTDLATYVINTVIKVAQRKVARTVMPPLLDETELTPEEHLRLAAQAREDSMEIDEFFHKLREDLARDRASRRNAATG